MSAIVRHGLRAVFASAVLLGLALYAGCGSKEKTETPATQETTNPSTQNMGDTEAQKPSETVDWAKYDNPKPGICPVCGMNLNPDYVEVASIGEKEYACCSSHCVTMLTENPAKYLTEGAPSEGTHEGHGH